MQTIKTAAIKDMSAALRLNSEKYKIGIENVGIISGSDVVNMLISKYKKWCFEYDNSRPFIPANIPQGWDDERIDAYSIFIEMWYGFVNVEMNNSVAMAIKAIKSEYDPISNYDKTSEIKRGTLDVDYTETQTPSGKKKIEESDTGTETNTLDKSGQIETETSYGKTDTNKVSTDENATFRDERQSVGGGSDTVTETYGANDEPYTETDTKSFTDRKHTTEETYDDYQIANKKEFDKVTKLINTSGDDVTNYEHMYERTSGNIGVTTSQQMIESSIALALNNLTEKIVSKFVTEYLFI